MLGKVYRHNNETSHLGEKGSICYVHNRLYYRSKEISPEPLIEIDAETLQEIEKPAEYKNNIPNAIFPEYSSGEIYFPHSDFTTDDEDFATGQSRAATEKRLLRPSTRSPMFSDGRYIYIISQWSVKANSG